MTSLRCISKSVALACALTVGSAAAVASDTSLSDEASVLTLLAEIRARQAELEARERILDERDRNLAELERVVARQLDEIAAQHQLVADRIQAWEAQNGARIKQLAKIYAAMDPGRAARLLEELDANLATQILSRMKHKQSAAVLQLLEEQRALTVSRQVAHPLSFEPTDPGPGVVQ